MEVTRLARPLSRLVSIALLSTLTGCGCFSAHPLCEKDNVRPNDHDPYEPCNREIYNFNSKVDKYVTQPLAKAYKNTMPSPARRGLNNFFNNLNTVPTMANDIMQGDMKHTAISFWRLVINTTVGIGGLFDVASDGFDLPKHDNDFGLTLAYYGYTDSAYIVIPFLGPSTVRDGMGYAVDYEALSVPAYADDRTELIYDGTYILHTRAKLLPTDRVIEQSLDPYVFVRNAYMQRREAELEEIGIMPENESVDEDDSTEPADDKAGAEAAEDGSNPEPASTDSADGAPAAEENGKSADA